MKNNHAHRPARLHILPALSYIWSEYVLSKNAALAAALYHREVPDLTDLAVTPLLDGRGMEGGLSCYPRRRLSRDLTMLLSRWLAEAGLTVQEDRLGLTFLCSISRTAFTRAPGRFWRRQPRDPVEVRLKLDPGTIKRGVELPGAPGVLLRGKLATASRVPGLPAGTRALSLFLVNQRPGEKGKEDERFLFQVRLELAYEGGFLPRPNWRGENANDFDERVADLQFRDKVELAVGHAVWPPGRARMRMA